MADAGFRIEHVDYQAAAPLLRRVREPVFVQEQKVPLELEWDDLDPASQHVLALDGAGNPIGTGRLTPKHSIGRMAVLPEWRGRGVGEAILAALVDRARESGWPDVTLAAQVHAIGFYARAGFLPEGDHFDDAGIDHLLMRRNLRAPGTIGDRRALVAATLGVVAGARRALVVYSRDLDPGVFDRPEVVEASILELQYHADLMDLMGLDQTHKIQLHTGGVYGDKPAATDRFVAVYETLDASIRKRLVIENEERHFNLADNLRIHERTGIPLLFDTFHHDLFNEGESLAEALDLVQPTWEGHGPAMLDYSSQDPDKRWGAHTPTIDLEDFSSVLDVLDGRDVDVMLEIKDKEKSALAANEFLRERAAARSD